MLIRLLGRGGMGAVYEAEDQLRGGRVALKVMLQTDAERLLCFKQEFRIVAELDHPNLVRLFDLSVEDACWFFTMELVDGQPLSELLNLEGDFDTGESELGSAFADGPARDWDEAPDELGEPACELEVFRKIVGQLLDALEHLHARGIVHRDLKPSNVLVDLEGRVRLVDFGLANQLDRAKEPGVLGKVGGTLGYAAPEQILGEAATPASDFYSLGCLMFWLLTARLPFEGSMAQILRGHLHGARPRVDRRVRGVPPEVAELCFRLLAQDPAARPTIAELRAALAARREPAAQSKDPSDVHFVGREAELSALRSCFERAEAGSAEFVLVAGASGIGKSSLVEHALEEAVARGHKAFRGRCYEREELPFMTLDRAVDAMIVTLAAWPADKLRPYEDALRDLERPFPAMAMLTRGARPSKAHEGAADLRRSYRRFVEVLARFASEQPAVLVLDDLQWADEESIELLEVLLAEMTGRLTVVGTCREEALAPERPGGRLLSAAGAAGSLIRLAPLGHEEAHDLIERVARGRIDARTRAAIAEQAEGNAFLLVELAHRFGDRSRAFAPAAKSESVIAELLADLSEDASKILSIAATAGAEVSEELLAEAGGMRGAAFDRALRELFARRLVKRLAHEPLAHGPSRRLDLYHDRIREAAYQSLSRDHRRALHEAIARVLEAQGSDHTRDIEALLRHWTLAGDMARRRRFALRASARAEEQLAYRHAARLLSIVLESPDPGERASETMARWERLGDLYAWSGQLAAAAEAYARALEGWERRTQGEAQRGALLRLRGKRGEALMIAGSISEGLAELERGAALVGFSLARSPALHGLVLATLALRVALAPLVSKLHARRQDAFAPLRLTFLGTVARSMAFVSPTLAVEAALRGELLAFHVRDLRVLVRARAARAVLPALLGRPSTRRMRRAWLSLNEAAALAREAGDAEGACVVRASEGLLWLRTDMERARRTLESALAELEARGMSDSYDGALTRIYLLVTLMLKGDFRDVLSLADRELARAHEHRYGELLALGLKALAFAYLGRPAEAERAWRAMRPILAPMPMCALHALEALAHTVVRTAQGRFAEALEEARAFERRAARARVRRGAIVQTVAREAALEACLGLARTAGLSLEERAQAMGFAAWLVRHGMVDYACMGHRGRALLLHHAGEAAAARRAIEAALDASRVNASRFHRYLCLEAARALRGLSASQAEECAALERAGALGAPLYLARASIIEGEGGSGVS